MTKNVMKIIAVLLVAILSVAVLSQAVLATDLDAFKEVSDKSGASDAFTSIIGSVINIVQIIGTGVAIIMLVVLAIKYISAAPGDKAEIKKHAVVYIVGAIVLFAATGILQIVKNFASGNINDVVSEVE